MLLPISPVCKKNGFWVVDDDLGLIRQLLAVD